MKNISKLFKSSESRSIIFLILIFAIVGIVNPTFISATSLLNCFNDSVVFTTLAVGIAFVIFTGEIDVSIGSTLGLSAAVTSSLLRDGKSWLLALIVGLLIGLVIGLINGVGIAVLKIPSLIFTLAMNGVIRGLIYVYTGGSWVENLPPSFTALSQLKVVSDLTLFYLITIVVVLLIDFYTKKAKKGRYFIATGDNLAGAKLVGIPTTKVKIAAHILCAVFATIAGIVYSSRIGFITPMAGNGYEMKAIAACVIGGVSLVGGQGSIAGAAIGAVIMSSVSRILVFLGFSSDYDNTITGVLLISLVVMDALLQKYSDLKSKKERLLAKTKK